MPKRTKRARAGKRELPGVEVLWFAEYKALGEIMPTAWHYDNTPGGKKARDRWYKQFFEGLATQRKDVRIVKRLVVDPKRYRLVPIRTVRARRGE